MNISKEQKKKRTLKHGNPINLAGRPKGAKDKIARSVKKDIEQAFEKLGGVDGLVAWAKKSNGNKEKLYQWYFSMLPKNENIDHSGEVTSILKFHFGENGE